MKKTSLLKSVVVTMVALSLGGCVTCNICPTCYLCMPVGAKNERIEKTEQVQNRESEKEILAKQPITKPLPYDSPSN